MFCKNCGKELSAGAEFCENCGMAAGQGMNYCANCGAALLPGAFACTQCGTATGNTAGTTYVQEPQAKGSNVLAIVSLVCGLVSLLCGCGLTFLPGVAAIVCGGISLGKKQDGKGMAVAGLILGIISVILGIIVAAFYSYLVVQIVQGNFSPEDFSSYYGTYNW